MDFLQLYKIIIPELYIFSTLFLLFSYATIFSTSKSYHYPMIQTNVGWLSIFSLFITFFLVINNSFNQKTVFNNLLMIDDFGTKFKACIIIASILILLMSKNYVENKKINSFEFYICILMSVLAMFLLVSTYDLISLYLSIELMTLSFYILATYKRFSEFSAEAGLKYFLLGAFSSGILLFGISLIYSAVGSTSFPIIQLFLIGKNCNLELSSNGLQTLDLGLFFIIIALLFKLAAAPFHMWAPDVYEGAPTPVTAFFSAVPKLAVLGVMMRMLYYFSELIYFWQYIIIFASLLSLIIGSLGALYQKKIKRLMAYSGIANIGLILMGLAVNTFDSLIGVGFFIVVYIIMNLSFFSVILGNQKLLDSKQITTLSDFTNFGKTNSVIAFSIILVMFSMLGLPPFLGFFSKLFVFMAAIENNFIIISVIAILSTVIAAFYYIRIIKIMFFDNSFHFIFFKKMDKLNAYILSISIFFLTFGYPFTAPLVFALGRQYLSLINIVAYPFF